MNEMSAVRVTSPETFFQTNWKASAGEPHVFATAGEGIALIGGIVGGGARMQNRTDIAVIFEYANRLGSTLRQTKR